MSAPRNRATQPTADLAPVSRGLPVEWELILAGRVMSCIDCPDETTAKILGTFRYGTDVVVRRQGARS